MKIAVFNTKPYDRKFIEIANKDFDYDVEFFEVHLNKNTTILAKGFECVCIFVNDHLNREILTKLHEGGTRIIALRCAGFNNVNLKAAADLGMQVVRVPAYSPNAVAEHTLAMLLSLNRRIHRAYNRVREGNFNLDGLMGFDVHGKTVGIIGTGKIGELTAKLFKAFGCRVLAYDVMENEECLKAGIEYKSLEEIFASADIISLHCPLLPATKHIINDDSIALMKEGVYIINTSRGGLIDTNALITGIKNHQIGGVGLDVYEEESNLFFENLSDQVIKDDTFSRLLTFPNVLITGHQAYFTDTALTQIAQVTMSNIKALEVDGKCKNEVHFSTHKGH